MIIEEKLNAKNFQESGTKVETYESIEEKRYPQHYGSDLSFVNTLDDLNEKEMNDRRVQAKFKHSRHSNMSIFIISHYYYESV